jgi:4-amino-4-deoxy-L-arabinose transferase-like glycosyltransferase
MIIMKKVLDKLFSDTLFLSVLVILVIWNIWSLTYSPIVWFDEVFMASISHSLVNGNGFSLEIHSGQQIFIYGPVYFFLTGISFLIGGVNAFTFRIINLIFAFFTVLIIYNIMGKLKIKEIVKRLIVLMFLIDVIFSQNSHSGRMEFVATCFTLLCFFYYLKDKLTTSDYCFIALFASISCLTTPRVAVILLPILLFVFIRLINEKRWSAMVLFLSIPTFIYLSWILGSYGSVNAWIDYYTSKSNESGSSNVDLFFGGSFYIPKYQYPLLFGALVVILNKVIRRKFKITLLFLIPIITYYFLVKTNSGLYTVFILPFIYIFLAMGLEDFSHSKGHYKYSYYAIISLCFLVNLGIFGFKVATVVSSIEDRDQKALNGWIVKNIKKNSYVVGSECYFYGCLANNNSLGLLYPDIYFSDRIKPKYLLINKSALNDERIVKGLETFKSRYDLEYVTSYIPPRNSNNFFLRFSSQMGVGIEYSYWGDLYEVKLKLD